MIAIEGDTQFQESVGPESPSHGCLVESLPGRIPFKVESKDSDSDSASMETCALSAGVPVPGLN